MKLIKLILLFLLVSACAPSQQLIALPDHADIIDAHDYRPLIMSYRPEAHFSSSDAHINDQIITYLQDQRKSRIAVKMDEFTSDPDAFDVQLILYSNSCKSNQCFYLLRFVSDDTVLLVQPYFDNQEGVPVAKLSTRASKEIISILKKTTP